MVKNHTRNGRKTQKRGGVSVSSLIDIFNGTNTPKEINRRQAEKDAKPQIIGSLNCLGKFENPFEFKSTNSYSEIEKLWINYLNSFDALTVPNIPENNIDKSLEIDVSKKTEINERINDMFGDNEIDNYINFFNHITTLDNKVIKEREKNRLNKINLFCSIDNNNRTFEYTDNNNYKDADKYLNNEKASSYKEGLKLWDDICNLFIESIKDEALTTYKSICSGDTVVLSQLPKIVTGKNYIIACQEFTENCKNYVNSNNNMKLLEGEKELSFIYSESINLRVDDNDYNFSGLEEKYSQTNKKFDDGLKTTLERIFVCYDDENVYVNIHTKHMSDPDSKPKTYDKQKELYKAIYDIVKEKHENENIYILSDTNMEEEEKDITKTTTQKLRSTMQSQQGKANVEVRYRKDRIFTVDNIDSKSLIDLDVNIYPKPKEDIYLPILNTTENWLSDHCLVYILNNGSNESTPP